MMNCWWGSTRPSGSSFSSAGRRRWPGNRAERIRLRSYPMSIAMTARSFSIPRTTVVAITALVILTPLSLIFWQSFLNAPFFNPAKHLGLDAYRFIFEDPDFWNAFLNSVVIAAGMVLIALPLGAALAFLLTRTDLPG